jgi:lipoprotein-anchoring transpeptidase ErfK/SrfK
MRKLVLVVVAAVVLTACGSGTSSRTVGPTSTLAPATVPSTTAPPTLHLVATATVPTVAVFDAPDQPEPSRTLDNPFPSAALGEMSPLVLLVRERQGDWLKVLLPVRPNGSEGWIRQSEVTLKSHDWRILVELGAHQITVWRGNEVFVQEPVGVGTSATGTPGGLFYTTELLRPEGQPAYGPYAYALSGFSEVHYEFAGGPGVLGIHGTNDPGALGTDVSNGCIRMSNEGITKLAENLPVGVPVEVRA